MSDQPTEKHEFMPEHNYARATAESIERAQRVHQPSAVQAPEQATPRNRDWYVSDGLIIRDADDNEVASVQLSLHDNVPAKQRAELIVLAVNNYEAQAVRIRELEDALRALRPFVAVRDIPTIDAALKPKEGK